MKKNEPVRKVMSADPLTVHTAQKVSDVQKILSGERLHHLPVVSGKKLVGIISSTDLMKLSFSLFDSNDASSQAYIDRQFSITDLMQKDVISVTLNSTVRDAAEALSAGGFHAVPVVDDANNLAGIVTTTDLITYLLDQY
jgi:CBS domain-containing protein